VEGVGVYGLVCVYGCVCVYEWSVYGCVWVCMECVVYVYL